MNDGPMMVKDAVYIMIHRHPSLSVEAIAEQLGMATSYLYRAATPDPDMAGPDASGVRFPLKLAVPLTKITGNFLLLDTMEQLCGRVAVPIPQPSGLSIADLQSGAIKAAAEFGDVMQEIHISMKDNSISAQECKRITDECWQAIQSIMELIVKCDQSENGRS